MHRHLRPILTAAEDAARLGGAEAALRHLRLLGLTDFGQLMWSLPDANWPVLSSVLPRMAPEEAQRHWTGDAGRSLMLDTATFQRILALRFRDLTNRRLQGSKILDYGCGYGRNMRLLYHFTDPANITGLDVTEESLALCADCGMLGSFAQISPHPIDLPVDGRTFDLIFSYSVFTHISPRSTIAALQAMRKVIRPDGVLAITSRPPEFWHHQSGIPAEQLADLVRAVDEVGFGYFPFNIPPLDGDVTYGDSVITHDWFIRNFPEWEYRGYDRGVDPWQDILFFTPR